MKNLDEKIFELLKKSSKPLSIGEIQKCVSSTSRLEVTRTLQTLDNQGLVYRKLIDGKPYYSIKHTDGDGHNPNKKNINDMQIEVNKILNDIVDLDLENNNEMIKEDKIDLKSIKLEYSNKQVFENEKYSLEIPDNFKIIKEEGRDFVAYLENPNHRDKGWDMGGSIITIFPSHEIPNMDNLKLTLPEVNFIIYDLSFWTKGFSSFRKIMGTPNYYKIKLSSGMVRIIAAKNPFGLSYDFYILCSIKGALKQFHIQFTNINGTLEEMLKISEEIMDKFVGKENNVFIKLESPEFFKKDLDQKKIDEYANLMKELIINLNIMFSLGVKAVQAEAKAKHEMGQGNIIELKTCLKECLNLIRDTFEKYLDIIVNFVETAQNNNIKKEVLKDVYGYLKVFINNNKSKTVTIDDNNEVSVKSPKASIVYKKIFTEDVLEIIKDFKIDEEKGRLSKGEQVSEQLQNNCDDFIKKSQRQLDNFKRDWNNYLEDYQNDLNSRTITSEYQLNVLVSACKNNIIAFGDKYDNFIIAVDKNGKILLNQGANSYFVDKVCKIIKETISAINNLSVDFSTSGSAYLNLGTFDYEVSSKLIDIKYWWEKKYNEMPDVVERRKAEKEARNKEMEERQVKIDSILDKLNKNLENDLEEWTEEIKEIDSKKNDNIKNYRLKREKELEKSIEKLTQEKDLIEEDIDSKIKEIQKLNQQAEEELNSLGLLKFIRKDQLKEEMDINNQNIGKYQDKLIELGKDLEKEINEVTKKYKDDIKDYETEINKKFIYPTNPKDIIEDLTKFMSIKKSETLTKTQQELNEQQEKVYLNLVNIDRPVTVTELQSFSDEMMQMSNQKICHLLKKIEDAGRVVKIVNNKRTYFFINNGTYENKLNTNKVISLKVQEIETKFAIDRKNIAILLEKYSKPVALNEFIKNNKLLDKMTLMRIYQVLKSFVDEGIIKRKIEDNEIFIINS